MIIFARDSYTLTSLGTNGQQNSVILSLQFFEFDITSNGSVEFDLDTKFSHGIDITIQFFSWQTVIGDTNRHHASSDRHGIKNSNPIAPSCQVAGSAESGGTCADNRYTLSKPLFGWSNLACLLRGMIGCETLQITDGDG